MTSTSKNDVVSKTNVMKVEAKPGQSRAELLAEIASMAITPAASVIKCFATPTWGELDFTHVVDQLKAKTNAVQGGDLREAEAMLAAQATALNMLFAELARRSGANMGEHIDAADTYMRLALRAQNQCRSTLETLATIKNPPVVFAKQANISHGHQQINNSEAVPLAHAETEIEPIKQLEAPNAKPEWMDTSAACKAIKSHSPMGAVAQVNRPKDHRR